jgi:hypothetical protein
MPERSRAVRKKRYVKSAARKTQILDLLKSSPYPLTRRQIGEALGLSKSPHLIRLLEELLAENQVCVSVLRWRRRSEAYVYSYNDLFGRPEKARLTRSALSKALQRFADTDRQR